MTTENSEYQECIHLVSINYQTYITSAPEAEISDEEAVRAAIIYLKQEPEILSYTVQELNNPRLKAFIKDLISKAPEREPLLNQELRQAIAEELGVETGDLLKEKQELQKELQSLENEIGLLRLKLPHYQKPLRVDYNQIDTLTWARELLNFYATSYDNAITVIASAIATLKGIYDIAEISDEGGWTHTQRRAAAEIVQRICSRQIVRLRSATPYALSELKSKANPNSEF